MQIVAALLVLLACARPASTATTAQIWTDPYTGFAIGGFDPIAYFADGRAQKGVAQHEWTWRGVTWRFVNEGNLAAFRDFPELYVPEFGGYGAMAIALGYTGIGNPQIWAVRDGRLYLFYSSEDRLKWQVDPDKWIAKAQENWPHLRQSLAF